MLVELEAQAARQGYSRIYLTTGFRQPEAVGLYLNYGYTALFDHDCRSGDPQDAAFREGHQPSGDVGAPERVSPSSRQPTENG